MNTLPQFRYHPDPLSTGSVKKSDAECLCCGKQRGYIYAASVYAEEELQESICPWCIADGSAAERFDAIFSDDQPLAAAGVPMNVIEEVTRRTPGYVSWQQEEWLACCGDACEFHGDAPADELRRLSGEALTKFLAENRWSAADWSEFVKNYEPGGNPAVYKFICRRCNKPRFGVDFT